MRSVAFRFRSAARAAPRVPHTTMAPVAAAARWASNASAAAAAAPSFQGQVDRALAASYVQTESSEALSNKSQVAFSIREDEPGALQSVLALFGAFKVNMSRIESKPSKGPMSRSYDFIVDFDGRPGQANVDALLNAMRQACPSVAVNQAKVVPWFPTRIGDIDAFSSKTLDAGAELESDHPGFSDEGYRARRRAIVEAASTYRHGMSIPRVDYTKEEVATWGAVYAKLGTYTRQFAVEQYNTILPLLEKNCGYSPTNIPQLQDISDFLKSATGFTIRPVGGLLSARDFLNALAFRVFFSTQYIRHHSRPLYTPEPDVVHELMGHAPMFADPDFADFSHEIGLASLGASDDDIKKLATCYWFSVEFGLAWQGGARKAYGAGLLSSFGELEYACAPYRPAGGTEASPEYRAWEPRAAAVQAYPITTYQPVYYVADSLADAKARMREYCDTAIHRGFNVKFDPASSSVRVDRAVVRGEYTVTLQTGNYSE